MFFCKNKWALIMIASDLVSCLSLRYKEAAVSSLLVYRIVQKNPAMACEQQQPPLLVNRVACRE
jgi:hypothetical protein